MSASMPASLCHRIRLFTSTPPHRNYALLVDAFAFMVGAVGEPVRIETMTVDERYGGRCPSHVGVCVLPSSNDIR